MSIGGLQKFSLIDYPGKSCAILFTRGCNFRCGYCHNPELVIPERYEREIAVEEIFGFLEGRRGKLDAVSITGGEPTLHRDLIDFMRRIKEMGFLVKLDSNGWRPELLENIIKEKIVDYFAMDVKAPLEDYAKVIGWKIDPENLRRSIELIMNSGVEYEFRTTIVRSLISKDDLRKIAKTIRGAKNYYLQMFRVSKLVDESYGEETTYSREELESLAKEFLRYVGNCGVR